MVTATLRELGEDALDPRACGLYPDEFYQANPYVHRFDPERPITWVWGWSLRDQRPLLVPEVLVYYHAASVEERFVQETSNGCASGGSLVEAVYHGLMEAIERDAFLLAWYGARSLPEIDPASIDRPQTRMMIDRLAMYGYRARFFDTRMTFDIPVVTAVAIREDGGLGTLAFGGGASLDPQAAITAALCEIATDSVMVRVRAGADEARAAPDGDRLLPGAGPARPPVAVRPAARWRTTPRSCWSVAPARCRWPTCTSGTAPPRRSPATFATTSITASRR